MSTEWTADEKETHNIFILGLCVLFAWMLVIVICASPQLFRNLLIKYACCGWNVDRKRNQEKIKLAQARMMTARRSIMTQSLAEKPSELLVLPILGRTAITPIPEESRAGTQPPEGDEPDIEILPLNSPSVS